MVDPGVESFVRVDSDVEVVLDRFNKIATNLPKAEKRNTEKIAEMFKEEVQSYLADGGTKPSSFDGDMASNVKIINTPGASGDGLGKGLIVDVENNGINYAVWHEFAKTGHYVSVEDAPSLRRWVKQSADNVPSDYRGALYVKPHPFVRPASQRATEKMRKYVNQGGAVTEMMDNVLDE